MEFKKRRKSQESERGTEAVSLQELESLEEERIIKRLSQLYRLPFHKRMLHQGEFLGLLYHLRERDPENARENYKAFYNPDYIFFSRS